MSEETAKGDGRGDIATIHQPRRDHPAAGSRGKHNRGRAIDLRKDNAAVAIRTRESKLRRLRGTETEEGDRAIVLPLQIAHD